MTLTSLVAAVEPHKGKIIKSGLNILKEEKFATKWYITLCI